MPLPIEQRYIQDWQWSAKSHIRLGTILKPRKCIGVKVNNIPINTSIRCNLDIVLVDDRYIPWDSNWSCKYIIPVKIAITVPKDKTKWKWVTT